MHTKFCSEKPEGNRQLGRRSRRWEAVTMDLKEIGFEVVERIHLTQDRDQ